MFACYRDSDVTESKLSGPRQQIFPWPHVSAGRIKTYGSVALLSLAKILHAEHDPGLRWTDLSCERIKLVGE